MTVGAMRAIPPWMAVGLLLAGCAPEPTPFTRVADVTEVMTAILEPAADTYWDAVGWIDDEKGTHEIAPASPEEWEAVRNAAFVIAESGNLLMMRGRARDRGEWMTWSDSLVAMGRAAIAAAEARNVNAVFNAGAEVYYVCSGCHARYALDLAPPVDSAQ